MGLQMDRIVWFESPRAHRLYIHGHEDIKLGDSNERIVNTFSN